MPDVGHRNPGCTPCDRAPIDLNQGRATPGADATYTAASLTELRRKALEGDNEAVVEIGRRDAARKAA